MVGVLSGPEQCIQAPAGKKGIHMEGQPKGEVRACVWRRGHPGRVRRLVVWRDVDQLINVLRIVDVTVREGGYQHEKRKM